MSLDVLLLANARSGRGRGFAGAQHVADRVREAGYRVSVLAVGPGVDPSAISEAILRSRAVVAAGGDGTVHHAAASILATSRAAGVAPVPIYHLPWGNENLFAREFGMDRRAATLIRALHQRRVRVVDVAWIRADGVAEGAGRLFLIMAGFGPDASVIHRLDATRSRAVGHAAYVLPIMAELRAPSFPAVNVLVDGRRVVDGVRGMLVVANCRQYASRLDPARGATMTDGVLDTVFIPARGVREAIGWAVRCRLRRQARSVRFITAKGREVRVERADGGPNLPCQIDGESLRVGSDAAAFAIRVEAGVLPVLVP